MTTEEIMFLVDMHGAAWADYERHRNATNREARADYRSNVRAAIESLAADAARYRWLREHPAWETEAFLSWLTPQEFDTAVDAAMGGQSPIRMGKQ